MSDNTAASTPEALFVLTPDDLRNVVAIVVPFDLYAASCNTADALDSLRESVEGCGQRYPNWNCGEEDGARHLLCDACCDRRDRAIRQLLGSDSEAGK